MKFSLFFSKLYFDLSKGIKRLLESHSESHNINDVIDQKILCRSEIGRVQFGSRSDRLNFRDGNLIFIFIEKVPCYEKVPQLRKPRRMPRRNNDRYSERAFI